MSSPDHEMQKPDFVDQEDQATISELFHLISQPLTGLHCLLEVSLMKKQTAAGYRRDLQTALEATHRLAESLRLARELAEADCPGETRPVDISALLRQILEEFSPLLDATHVQQHIKISPGLIVGGDPEKLQKAIFYIFDNVLHELPLGSDLLVELEDHAQIVSLFLGPPTTSSASLRSCAIQKDSRTLSISQRIIEANGGKLLRSEGPNGKCFNVELLRIGL